MNDSRHYLPEVHPGGVFHHGAVRCDNLEQLAAAGMLHDQAHVSVPEHDI
jgi:hypothetical protein|eukprot:COSAG01_NODE_1628_length_9684_cov_9.777673_12_plen_50_part_00